MILWELIKTNNLLLQTWTGLSSSGSSSSKTIRSKLVFHLKWCRLRLPPKFHLWEKSISFLPPSVTSGSLQLLAPLQLQSSNFLLFRVMIFPSAESLHCPEGTQVVYLWKKGILFFTSGWKSCRGTILDKNLHRWTFRMLSVSRVHKLWKKESGWSWFLCDKCK